MNDATDDQARWNVMLVQARRFAAQDQLLDAVARTRLVRDQVRQALEGASGAGGSALEAQLARADKLLGEMETRTRKWRTEVEARRWAKVEHADAEMERPLPR